MKTTKFILTFVAAMFFVGNAQAGLLFNYSQLALKDLDQMSQLVNDKIKESKKVRDGRMVPLKEALQAVYSRPNDDDMIEKVVAPLRTSLDEIESWEKSISQLTDEAIGAIKNPRPFKPVVQVTYVIFLENLLAEIKPMVKNDGFERRIAEKIRDAKLEITKDAVGERKLRMMKDTVSPSEIAGKILTQTTDESAEKTSAK